MIKVKTKPIWSRDMVEGVGSSQVSVCSEVLDRFSMRLSLEVVILGALSLSDTSCSIPSSSEGNRGVTRLLRA